MKNVLFPLVGFCLSVFCGVAQTLEEKTEVLDAPFGETRWTQEGGTQVYAFPDEKGWYRVRRKVYVAMDQWNGKEIAAGAELQNEEGEKIGETRRSLAPQMADTISGFREAPRLKAILEGKIFQTKIEEGSIPEERLQEILNLRNRRDQLNGFERLKADFEMQEREFEEFDALVLRAQHRSLKEPGEFRIILVKRGTLPFAVMAKDHPIHMERPKDSWALQDMQILYSYNPTDEQKKLMEEILFTYLTL